MHSLPSTKGKIQPIFLPSLNILEFPSFTLPLYLGVRKEEKLKKQPVSFIIKLCFSSMPKGCTTDNIEDTFCYEKIINDLSLLLLDKEYCLLESLALESYLFLKQKLSDDRLIFITVKKKLEKGFINGDASYSCGDSF